MPDRDGFRVVPFEVIRPRRDTAKLLNDRSTPRHITILRQTAAELIGPKNCLFL
jgi:hypothetical protein